MFETVETAGVVKMLTLHGEILLGEKTPVTKHRDMPEKKQKVWRQEMAPIHAVAFLGAFRELERREVIIIDKFTALFEFIMK